MGSQQELEDIISWWVGPLGLSHYLLDIHWGKNVNKSSPGNAGDAWICNHYPRAKIGVQPPVSDDAWQLQDVETTAIHELTHILLQPMALAFYDALDMQEMPSKPYYMIRESFERTYERAVETLALALVAVAHADRSGTAPSIGGIVKREENAT